MVGCPAPLSVKHVFSPGRVTNFGTDYRYEVGGQAYGISGILSTDLGGLQRSYWYAKPSIASRSVVDGTFCLQYLGLFSGCA